MTGEAPGPSAISDWGLSPAALLSQTQCLACGCPVKHLLNWADSLYLRTSVICQGRCLCHVCGWAVFGGFPQGFTVTSSQECVCSHSHQWKCPPASRSYLEPERTLPLSVVLFLSSQFPFLHLRSGLSPDIISLSLRGVLGGMGSSQRLLFIYSWSLASVFLGNATGLMPLVSWSCSGWALVTGMFSWGSYAWGSVVWGQAASGAGVQSWGWQPAREWARRGERRVIKPFDHQARFLDCVHWRWDVAKMCLFKSDPFVCFDELRDIRGRK